MGKLKTVLAAAMVAVAAVGAFADEPAKEYSQRRMIEVLADRGYYFQFRDFMQNSAGGIYWDLFVASQVIRSDDRFFMQLVPMLEVALGISGDLVQEILDECEVHD